MTSRPAPLRRRGLAAGAALFVALLPGCPDPPRVTVTRVPRERTADDPWTGGGHPGGGGDAGGGIALDLPAPPPGGSALPGPLPAGWRLDPRPRPVRRATLLAGEQDPVEVSVTVLPGAAGGPLANVNRWRAELGLAPLADAAALAAEVVAVTGRALLVDLRDASGTRRVLAGFLPRGGETWFLKAAGAPARLDAVRDGLAELLRTLDPATTAGADEAPRG